MNNLLISKKTPEQTLARTIGTHLYYLNDYYNARKIYSDKNLENAFTAMLKADIALKTTSIDDQTLMSILIAEIIPD